MTDGIMMTQVEFMQSEVARHMDDILKHFKAGAKITILVRRPEHEDGSQDFVMTNDNPAKAITALEIRKAAGPDD